MPERVAETIAHYNPDLALLQEVDDGVPRSRRHRQVDWFAEQLGYAYHAFQSNVKLREGSYGNAMLSRFPLDELTHVDLTIPMKKRRQALIARLHLRDGEHMRSVVVANVHLGLAGFERAMQIRRLLGHHCINHLRHATPTIIGGDFNDVWRRLGRQLLEPIGFRCALGKTNTFPAAYPVRALDRVFFRGDLALESSFAGHVQVARRASDHLPVVVDFCLTELS
jgi:endonuclease/exonuclease/phosphatase family metal-dependent hydrolase